MTDSSNRSMLSIRLPQNVLDGLGRLAEREGRDMTEQIEFLLTEALVAADLLPPDDVELHQLRESLLRRFVDTAERVYALEARADITSEAGRLVAEDPEFCRDHARFLELGSAKSLHPAFGRRIKARLGLETGGKYRVKQPNILGWSSYLLPPAQVGA